MLRILTIDDHEVVRRGIKEMFTEESVTFGEARSGAEALALARKQHWDIAVLDISLGGRSGLEVLAELKQLRPRMPVLILSMHAEEQYAVRAFKTGASGYINKASSGEELRRAILKIINGGQYFQARVPSSRRAIEGLWGQRRSILSQPAKVSALAFGPP